MFEIHANYLIRWIFSTLIFFLLMPNPNPIKMVSCRFASMHPYIFLAPNTGGCRTPGGEKDMAHGNGNPMLQTVMSRRGEERIRPCWTGRCARPALQTQEEGAHAQPGPVLRTAGRRAQEPGACAWARQQTRRATRLAPTEPSILPPTPFRGSYRGKSFPTVPL